MITSPDNKGIKYVTKLLSKAKQREEDGVFVVEGIRIFEEACKYAFSRIAAVYVSESCEEKNGDIIREYIRAGAEKAEDCKKAEGFGADYPALPFTFEIVKDSVFNRMCDTITPQGVLAVVRQQKQDAESLLAAEQLKLILLDRLQDPGNVGTILRTSEAAGFDAVILGNDTADIYNPKVIRSTMGAIFRVKTIRVKGELAEYMEKVLKPAGVKTHVACIEGAKRFDTVSYPARTAIIIGNEGNGISEAVRMAADENIYIPMAGHTESLNAAVSAAILMYSVK